MRVKVRKIWSHAHEREIAALSLAGSVNDTLFCDNRNRIVLLNPNGKIIWDKEVDFGPVSCRITKRGDALFILTFKGRIIRIDRTPEIEWDTWVDKDAGSLTIKARGDMVAVASHKGRVHLVDGRGNKKRLLHTPEPVAYIRFASRAGTLFAASARGWVGAYDSRGEPKGEFRLDEPIAELEVDKNGKRIFMPARGEGIYVIDMNKGELTTMHPGFPVNQIGIDAKGTLLAVAGLDGDIALLNLKGDILWQEKTSHAWFLCDMNESGDRFVVTSSRGEVFCYTITKTGEEPEEKEDTSAPDDDKPKPPKKRKKKPPGKGGKGAGDFDFLEV